MVEFKFEGDIENLAEPQQKLVQSVLQQRGYENGTVKVEAAGQKGDNYMALVKRFIYEANDGTVFKMIGKIAPTSEEARVMLNTVTFFNNETIIYNEVLPIFKELQNVVGVTDNEKVRFPMCYGTVSEAPFEFILLEDLKESGFEMLDRFQPLTNDSVRLVVKDLAIYHSLSYVLKAHKLDIYDNIASRLINRWTLLDTVPESVQFYKMLESDIIKMMDSDTHKNVVKVSLVNIASIARKMQNYEKKSKFSVILQGDCWNNNLLFRLEDGKSVQNVMIDYQMSRDSNPAADLLYLIFNCTDFSTRHKHYQEWIDYYHEILDNSLANHGLKANRIFPKDQLDAELKRYGKFMIAICALMSSIILRKSKDIIDIETTMEQMSIAALDTATITIIKESIEGIVASALEFGLV